MGLDIEIGMMECNLHQRKTPIQESTKLQTYHGFYLYKALNTQNSMLGHVPYLTFILFQYT
jgi:hypothetical protein